MKSLLFSLILLSSLSLTAQQSIRQVVGSMGGSYSAGGTTLSMTVGEAVVGSHQANSQAAIKGFQRPIQLLIPQRLGLLPSPNAQSFLLSELYPNPASERAFLHYQAENARISITDVEGKVLWIHQTEQVEGILSLPIHELAEGMYFVTLGSLDSQKTHKLIITR